MGTKNIIINGSFDNGAANWTGNDIEATHTENTYQNNGSTDNVSEVNGSGNQITVMAQTFTIETPQTTNITFEAAIRDNFRAVAGGDGFTVEIKDASGTVIFTQSILPTSTTFTTYSFPVSFASSGDYTVVITEIDSDNNSYGALIDDIEIMVVCLCAGTLIKTPGGECPIETLQIGDLVSTQNGPKPIRWIGRRAVDSAALTQNEKLRPVVISAGAMGNSLPRQALRLSRQHRMQVSSPITARMFARDDVLVSAIHLTSLPGIYIDQTLKPTTYYHMLFDAHEIISANGAASESLLPGPQAISGMTDAAREEIQSLFPALPATIDTLTSANYVPTGKQQKILIARHGKNKKPLTTRS